MEERVQKLEQDVQRLNTKLDQLIDLISRKTIVDCENHLIPGPRGKDGINGTNGQDGKDGTNGKDGKDGQDGRNGTDGTNGTNGVNGKDGINGAGVLTSYVFKRYNKEDGLPARPTGGDFLSPLPTTGNWTSNVPAGQGLVAVSTRIFSSNGLAPHQTQWSLPVMAADSSTLDFEWSSVDEPGNPTDNPDNWVNQATIDAKWMAIRVMTNNTWGSWNIVFIGGTEGPKGDPGDRIVYKYAKNGSYLEAPAVNVNERNPSGWQNEPLTLGVTEYLWKIAATINAADQLVGTWSIAIRETGVRGNNGEKGAYMAPRGEWSATTSYKGTTERLEAVKFDGAWYVTRSDNPIGGIPIGTLPTDTAYWNVSQENFEFIATGLFLAELAYIKNLGVESLKTSDTGERMEITPDANMLKFFNADNELNLKLGLSTVTVGSASTIPSLDPPTEEIAGLYLGADIRNDDPITYVSEFGVKVQDYDGPGLLYGARDVSNDEYFKQYQPIQASIVGISGLGEEFRFGGAFDKLFVESGITVTVTESYTITIGGEPFTRYRTGFRNGYTGVIGTVRYVNGICIGTA